MFAHIKKEKEDWSERPRRFLSGLKIKSGCETPRKLRDVIIVLWEWLHFNQCHNTSVAHYGNYCYTFYSLLLFFIERWLPRGFHLSPRFLTQRPSSSPDSFLVVPSSPFTSSREYYSISTFFLASRPISKVSKSKKKFWKQIKNYIHLVFLSEKWEKKIRSLRSHILIARKNERAWGARPNGRRASRYALSVACFIALSILV